MQDFDTLKLEDIFSLLNNKNLKIKETLDNISQLKLNINTEYIKKLSDVSDNLNNAFLELKEIYYHLIENDNSILKTDEEMKEIRTYKIDNIIRKTFLPYMMLMKIKLENQ